MHHLPLQLTSFIGREREVAEIARLLGGTRLLTVTGPGGVGKTRLTIEAARRARSDEVWFVELAPLLDGALVPSAIASALGLAEETQEPLLDTVIRYLQPRSGLLVLDNCEHLIVACAATVARLLQCCPSVTILATSREPLNLPGELVQRLPPLPPSEGAALFLDRATAAEPDFGGRPNEAGLIDSICGQLDGLPLAIELAAPYVRVLSVAELATRLDQRFDLLESRGRSADLRHQTLRALVDWSHDLLTPNEQRLYRRLSVFAGGCSLDAIEAICTDEQVTESAMLPLLRGLVEKSLVVADEQDGEMRYHMLETLRQQGAEKLNEAGEDTLLRRRHLLWFLELAERGKPGQRGPDEEWWRLRLQREMDNCRSALVWSQGETDQHDTALGLAAALARFWWLNGCAGEGAAWIEQLLAGAPPNLTRAKALAAAAWLALRRGDPTAQQLAEAALCLARELGDQKLIITILHYLGDARFVAGDPAGAEEALVEGLKLAEEIDWPYGKYPILRMLGWVMAALGRSGEAVACLRQAVALASEQRDLHMVSLIQSVQGAVLLDLGDVAGARECLEEGLALEPYPSAAQAAQKLALLAGVAVAAGDMTRAITLAGAATSLIKVTQGEFLHWNVARLERDLEPAFQALDPILRASAWDEGATMSLEEAVNYALRRDPTPNRSLLTAREREVAILLSRGLSNRDLAEQLVISENTAKRHVEKILAKLGLHSRARAASWAIREGLVGTGPVQDRAR